MNKKETATTTTTSPNILIDNKIQKQINVYGLSKEKLIQAIIKARDQNQIPLASNITLDFVSSSDITNPKIGASDLLSIFGARAPGELTRSLSHDFIFGFYGSGTGPKPFMIFKTGYYQNVSAGMLGWESSMKNDLSPIFVNQSERPAGTGSTTPAFMDKWLFEDIVIKNRDGRAMKNSAGKIVLLYSFTDKNTVVITTDEDTLQAVWNNFSTGKFAK
jgi:hypothetical protein